MDSLAEDELSHQRKEVVEKITKWFQEEGYVIEKTANHKSYYHAIVYYITLGKQKTSRIFIDIPKDSLDKIKVGKVFGYKLLEKPSYFAGDANNSNRSTAAISNSLDVLNVEWRIKAAVEDNEIEITKTIYFDGLSKHVLFETKGDVLAAYRASDITYKQLSKKV